MRRPWTPYLLDAVIAGLVGLWLAGGIEWQGRLVLRHGADPRRAALIIGGLGAWLWPAFRERSLWVGLARRSWAWLETRRGRRIALGSGFALACAIGVLQALALRVPLYDVGLFHQVLWSLAHGHGFVSTISGAGNFLLDHLSPSLALLVPAYWVSGSSPLALAILHPALVFTGAAAWVSCAERWAEPAPGREARPWLPAAATAFALFFDSLWGNLRWGFHENAIAFAALSWAFAWLMSPGTAEQGRLARWLPLALFCVAAGSKEILLVDVALALAAWSVIVSRRDRLFAIKLVLLAAALLAAFVWFEKMPHPADKNYFDRYYSYLGRGLGSFFKTLLLSPWVVVENVGARELLKYFLTVFMPWLFLPLWLLFATMRERATSALWIAAILPSLASAALATYTPLRGNGFHYVLELWPALAGLTVVALARMPAPGARRWAIAWAGLAALAWSHDPIGALREYGRGAIEVGPVRRALSEIPSQDAVLADELAGPWVASRLQVARWPTVANLEGGRCPRWVVLRSEAQRELTRKICGEAPAEERELGGEWRLLRMRSP
jgi:hypothetical protein